MKNPDFLIIGSGILGLCCALELKKRHPNSYITIAEKENGYGYHASGRNSGVLHAGFYYSADTLKALWTRQGNQEWINYCKENKLSMLQCGKLVVMEREEQLPMFEELIQRGKKNGVPLEVVTESEAKEIEPKVKTLQKALFSPSTTTIDPMEILKRMYSQCMEAGIEILFAHEYASQNKKETIFKNGKKILAGYFINASGLYADKIARDFNFGKGYKILPFKGVYLYSNYKPHYLKTHIYPLPDINYPFLGVHFTVQIDGGTKIGPTAMPAFWREQYGGWKNFSLSEFTNISLRHLNLFVKSPREFKKMALQEIRKRNAETMTNMASTMLEGVKIENFTKWGKPGIRAQLVDMKKMKLVMDFIVQGDKNSTHILNAVSPGFTCALPFSRYVCDQVEKGTTN